MYGVAGLFCGWVPSPFSLSSLMLSLRASSKQTFSFSIHFSLDFLAPNWYGYRLFSSFRSDAPQRHPYLKYTLVRVTVWQWALTARLVPPFASRIFALLWGGSHRWPEPLQAKPSTTIIQAPQTKSSKHAPNNKVCQYCKEGCLFPTRWPC
jgi:hypothetical protein